MTLSIGFTIWLTTLFFSSPETRPFLSAGLILTQLSGLFLLLRAGTLFKSLYWITIGALLILLVIGAVFKIQHWPGASLLLFLGTSGIASVYLVSFIFKTPKQILDVAKVLWVLSYSAQYLLRNVQVVDADTAYYWHQGNYLLFFLSLSLLVRHQHRKDSVLSTER